VIFHQANAELHFQETFENVSSPASYTHRRACPRCSYRYIWTAIWMTQVAESATKVWEVCEDFVVRLLVKNCVLFRKISGSILLLQQYRSILFKKPRLSNNYLNLWQHF